MVGFQKLIKNLFLTLHGQNMHRQRRQLSKFLMRYQQCIPYTPSSESFGLNWLWELSKQADMKLGLEDTVLMSKFVTFYLLMLFMEYLNQITHNMPDMSWEIKMINLSRTFLG
jgi:hypothetical protein